MLLTSAQREEAAYATGCAPACYPAMGRGRQERCDRRPAACCRQQRARKQNGGRHFGHGHGRHGMQEALGWVQGIGSVPKFKAGDAAGGRSSAGAGMRSVEDLIARVEKNHVKLSEDVARLTGRRLPQSRANGALAR